MLGINCLIKNTQLHQLAKDAVRTLGEMYVADGKIPTVRDIWRELQTAGFEIDVSSVGHLYMTELSSQSDEFYQHDEVEEQSSGAFNRAINKMINTTGKSLVIEDESPVEMVASALSRLHKSLTPNVNTKSVQRDLADILLKGIRRLLPANSPVKNSNNFEDVANAALVNQQKGFRDVMGNLNSLKQMHTELKKELAKYINELDRISPFEAAKFQGYVTEIMNSSYQLMFSKSEAKNLVVDALKDFQDGRFVRVTQTTDANGVVNKSTRLDWKEISKYATDANQVANMIQEVFESKLDANGDRVYSDEDIDIIKQSVAKEYQDLYKKNVVNKIGQAKANPVQIKNDWQKARDLVNKIADKFLPKKTTTGSGSVLARKTSIPADKIDEAKKELDERYNKGEFTPNEYRQASELIQNIKTGNAVVVSSAEATQFINGAMNNIFGSQKIAQLYKDGQKQFPDFLRDFKNSLGELGYSIDEQNLIANSILPDLENYFEKVSFEAHKLLEQKSKIKVSPKQREQFERLAELQSLGAFSSGKFNPLIYKALGVSELPIKSMQQIEAVTETINKLLDNVKNPLQANLLFKQLTSDINIILHNNITHSSNKIGNIALRTIHHFNLYTQAALNGILMNLFNMVQNVTANTMQMISTSVHLMTKTDWRYLNKNVKLFWNTLLDTGFRNGLVDGLQVGEFQNEARLDDYLRKSFKELFITSNSVGDRFLGIWKAVLTPFRVMGSAYDAAAKAVNTKKLFTIALDDVLKAKGFSKEARHEMISEALYDGKLLEDSIAEANRLIEVIGDKPNRARAYRMAQNIMAFKLVDSGTISEMEFNAIAKTAFKVSGKGLGHEYQHDTKDTDGLNLAVQAVSMAGRSADIINSSAQYWKNNQMANNNKIGYAIASLVANVQTSLLTKFIGGATRWIPLTAQAGGLGVLSASELIKEEFFGKKLELVNTNGELKNESDLKANLEKKLTKNEAFFRGLTGIAYTYTIGLIMQELLNTDCDPEDKDCIKNKESASNYIKETLQRKTDPHRNFMALAKDAFDGNGIVFDNKSYKFITQTFNIDNKFSPYEQMRGVLQNLGVIPMDFAKQKPDRQQGLGNLGRVLSNSYNSPIYAYFKAYDVMTKGKPPFEQPTGLNYGLFGGGLTEKLGGLKALGIKNDGVTGFKGVGGAKVDYLRSLYGINTKDELKKYLQSKGSFDGLKYPLKDKNGKVIINKDGTTRTRSVFSKEESATIREQLKDLK